MKRPGILRTLAIGIVTLMPSVAATAEAPADSLAAAGPGPRERAIAAGPEEPTLSMLRDEVGRSRVRASGAFGRRVMAGVSLDSVRLSGNASRVGAPDTACSLGWQDLRQLEVSRRNTLRGLGYGVVVGATPGAAIVYAGSTDELGWMGPFVMAAGVTVMVVGAGVGGVVGTLVGVGTTHWKPVYVAPRVVVGEAPAVRTIAMLPLQTPPLRSDRALRATLATELELKGYRVIPADSVERAARAALGRKESARVMKGHLSTSALDALRARTGADAILVGSIGAPRKGQTVCSVRLIELRGETCFLFTEVTSLQGVGSRDASEMVAREVVRHLSPASDTIEEGVTP